MDGKVVIGTELDTKSFESQINELEDKLDTLEQEYEGALRDAEFPEDELKKYQAEIEKTKNRIIDLKAKQDKLSESPASGILEWLKRAGKETERNVKKVTTWALAIFGIRGAYMAVRNAMNVITAQDEQLSADITYMKNAIAYTLEPVIRGIVNLMKQLMFYVAYIVKAWTGKNIFANANKGLKNATGSAKALNKELNKTIAGFDEMNVVSDTSGSSDTGGGAVLPSFDLTNLEDMPIPSWLQWIVDNKDIVIAGLAGIAGGLTAVKLGLDPIMALGIGVALAGIVYAIEGLIAYIQDPSWENFGQIIQGIGIFVIGLGIAFLGLPGIIAGAIILVVGTIIKYWDEIKAFLVNGIGWLEDSIGAIRDFFGDQVANIYETWITAFKGIIIGFDTLFKGLKQILDGIIQFVVGVFTGDWKKAWEGVKNIFGGIFNALKGVVITVFSFISGLVVSIAQTVGYIIADAFKFVVNGILTAIEGILNSPINAINKLINVVKIVPGLSKLKVLPTFKLPRLAKGGIINMPGKGVPVGSAIGGERGAEGVIPLTDSQQMALLGEAIGKYINVNATIPVYVGNRQIARELRKINAEDDFAYNG